MKKKLKEYLCLSGIDQNAFSLAMSEGLGYEVTDFCWAPQLENPAVLEKVRKQCTEFLNGRICRPSEKDFHESLVDDPVLTDSRNSSPLWFHAPFAELIPCAIDPLVQEITGKRYLQSVELARSLGINRIVIHGGFIPTVYFPEWYIAESVKFWKKFLRKLDFPTEETAALSDVQSCPAGMFPGGKTVRIALENVMEPDPQYLVDIVRGVNDPRLGLCLDVGHANSNVSEIPVPDWAEAFSPYLFHVHLHNNPGDHDLHNPLGEGTVPMEEVLSRLLETDATFTIENQNCQPSIAWLKQKGYL